MNDKFAKVFRRFFLGCCIFIYLWRIARENWEIEDLRISSWRNTLTTRNLADIWFSCTFCMISYCTSIWCCLSRLDIGWSNWNLWVFEWFCLWKYDSLYFLKFIPILKLGWCYIVLWEFFDFSTSFYTFEFFFNWVYRVFNIFKTHWTIIVIFNRFISFWSL